MLKKRERLTKALFSRFFKEGHRIHGTYVSLVFSPHPSFHGAAVVGKKVEKSAVARNRLRRQIYGALYNLRRTDALTGVYILLAKPGAKGATYAALAADIAAVIGRALKSK